MDKASKKTAITIDKAAGDSKENHNDSFSDVKIQLSLSKSSRIMMKEKLI